MQSFSQFTTQLDEATSDKPSLLRSAVDRLTGKKRKERLDRASKILVNLRDSGKLDKKIPYELGDGRGNKIKLATANVRMKSLASSLGKNKERIDSAAEKIAKKYNERTGKNVSVADVRKIIVRKAVSRATNRMKTRAARSRLGENLQQLDEALPLIGLGAAGLIGGIAKAILNTKTSVIRGGLGMAGQFGQAVIQNMGAEKLQKRSSRMLKRRELSQSQKQQDFSQGIVLPASTGSNLQINTNPRATVAQLRGSAGVELGGSSVGKQFAAKY